MLNLILGRNFTDKTKYMIKMAFDFAKNNDKVIIIVPEQFSLNTEKLVLEKFGGEFLYNAEVLSFRRLTEKIFKICGSFQKKYLDRAGKLILLMQAHNNVKNELLIYKNNNSDSFFDSLAQIYDELINNDMDFYELSKSHTKIKNNITRNKLHDLCLIFNAFEAVCENSSYEIGKELKELAVLLRDKEILGDTHIIFDGFNSFSAKEYLVVEQLINKSKSINISLCCDTLTDNDSGYGILSRVKTTGVILREYAHKYSKGFNITTLIENDRFKNNELLVLENNFFTKKKKPIKGNGNINLYTAKDVIDEVEYIACKIACMVRENGYDYKDFIIVSRDMSLYKGVIDTVFIKYEIPCFYDNKTSLKSKPIILFTKYILDMASYGFKTRYVLSALKTGLTEMDFDGICKLEQYVTYWDIDNYKWNSAFEWKNDPHGINSSKDGGELLKYLNELKCSFIKPLESFFEVIKNAPADIVIKELYAYLSRTGIFYKLDENNRIYKASGEQKAISEQEQVFDIFIKMLSQIVYTLEGQVLDIKYIRDIYEVAAGSYSIGIIPTSLNEITVGDIERLRVYNKKCAFVIGMNDGVFPKLISDNPILSDIDKIHSQSYDIYLSETSVDKTFEERFYQYCAYTLPTEKLFVSYHQAAGVNAPSSYFKDLKNILDEDDYTGFDEVTELSRIQRAKPCFDMLSLDYHDMKKELTEGLYEYFENKKDESFNLKLIMGECAENILSEQNASSIYTRESKNEIYISPSQLDTYAKCAFQYFIRYGLSVKEGLSSKFEAINAGNFVHFVLESAVNTIIANPNGFDALTDIEIRKLSNDISIGYLKEFLPDTQDNNRFLYLFKKISDNTTDILLSFKKEFAQSEFKIIAVELPVSKNDEVTPMIVELDNGVKMSVNGKIDRVDVLTADKSNFVRVVDYKTGEKTFSLTDIENGLDLQMLIYLFTLCENGQAVTGDNPKPAGVLYYPAKNKIITVGRELSIDEIEDAKQSIHKSSGLLINDEGVLRAMESELQERYIPVKSGRNGISSKNTVSPEQFEILKGKVKDNIKKTGEGIINGYIKVNPFKLSQPHCRYCKYSSICAVDLGVDEVRRLVPQSALSPNQSTNPSLQIPNQLPL